jgi:GNAT superfamily N-acetyltransferase
MDIREVSIVSAEAQRLIGLLDRELQTEYSPAQMHPVKFESFHRDGGVFVVAYDAATSVACGALRPCSERAIELKRMYVAESHRRLGVARRILEYLERKASLLGYERLLLETGDAQHAAIGLYENNGYHRIDAFGEYIGCPRSICFGKFLHED